MCLCLFWSSLCSIYKSTRAHTHTRRDCLSSVVTWMCHISPQCWPWGVLMLLLVMWFHNTSSHAGSQRVINTDTPETDASVAVAQRFICSSTWIISFSKPYLLIWICSCSQTRIACFNAVLWSHFSKVCTCKFKYRSRLSQRWHTLGMRFLLKHALSLLSSFALELKDFRKNASLKLSWDQSLCSRQPEIWDNQVKGKCFWPHSDPSQPWQLQTEWSSEKTQLYNQQAARDLWPRQSDNAFPLFVAVFLSQNVWIQWLQGLL